jgi:predicted nucleic acid-binding protein
MIIVVDTNIVFSGILNSTGKIGDILLEPNGIIKFYTTDLLLQEINHHKDKLIYLSKKNATSIDKIISIIIKRIKFVDLELIPRILLAESEQLLRNIDIDDTEFVALTTYLNGKLWTGDKKLRKGLENLGWDNCISTEELFKILNL